MKEHPIIFSGRMVRAILDGRKTQTRRIVKPQSMFDGKDAIVTRFPNQQGCPYGVPGDRLWVRETHCFGSYELKQAKRRAARGQSPVVYGTDRPRLKQYERFKWRPSIHMPRWASRITLEITDVRLQRLQEIGDLDAIAEGVKSPRPDFPILWDSINAKRAPWASNPWVWALTFKLC